MSRRRRFHLRRDGTVRVALPPDERDLLRSLIGQFRHLVAEPDPSDPAVARLQPPARIDDPDADAEWRALVGDQLRHRRLDAAERVLATLDGADLDDEGVEAWLETLAALRLVVGERVGAFDRAEPDDEPDEIGPLDVAFDWLALLLQLLVEEASGRLDDA